MNAKVLMETAKAMVPPGRGILAADESTRSTEKRFKKFDIPHTAETRRAYRIMMFTTPGLEKFISGVIMYDESLGQTAPDGKPFPKYLADKGIVPGVKVDTGFYPMAGFPGEFVTEGLDGLRERLAEYQPAGGTLCQVAGGDCHQRYPPQSVPASKPRRMRLARYAALCQEADIVPIVEPDVLLAGTPHTAALRRGHHTRPGSGLPRAVQDGCAAGRHDFEAQHGDARQGLPGPGQPAAGG